MGKHLPEPWPELWPGPCSRSARCQPGRPGAVRGGMCSLTAPFHLDKDFQGHVRSPARSSPAPMKSQARSPGPRCCSHPRRFPDTGTTCRIPRGSTAQPGLPSAGTRSAPRGSNTSVPVLQGWESSAASLVTATINTSELSIPNKTRFQSGPTPNQTHGPGEGL